MNLNPGKGDAKLQTRSNAELMGISRYQDVFGLLPDTHNWHSVRRAKPIGKALEAVHGTPAGSIENHLSVELIPWHTEHASNALGFWDYIASNVSDVFEHAFLFAAQESERIVGPLKKTIILRFSEDAAMKVFGLFESQSLICAPEISRITGLSKENVHASIFTFPSMSSLTEHKFVAIWRSKGFGLNNFPKLDNMIELFHRI